jgi:hypothetical protein
MRSLTRPILSHARLPILLQFHDLVPTKTMKTVLLLLVTLGTNSLSPCLSQEIPQSVNNARILDSQEVDLGDHKITYNRIEAPKLKPEPTKPVFVPAEPVPMTAQEEEELRKWEAKFQYSAFFSVTVYDGAFSEIRWWDDGQENVVWSNVNFLHFGPLGELETETAYFTIMLWTSETTSEEVRASNAEATSPLEMTALPPKELPPLAKAGPRWMSEGKLSEAAERAMEDLHDYYHIHGAAMAEEYNRREAEWLAHEEWVKAHPSIPPDTIVNFFPIRSSSRGVITAAQLEKFRK